MQSSPPVIRALQQNNRIKLRIGLHGPTARGQTVAKDLLHPTRHQVRDFKDLNAIILRHANLHVEVRQVHQGNLALLQGTVVLVLRLLCLVTQSTERHGGRGVGALGKEGRIREGGWPGPEDSIQKGFVVR